DHDVGARRERIERRVAGGIDDDAALAGGVEPEEEAPLHPGDVVPKRWHGPEIAAARWLDEHDVGAQAGQELSRKGAGSIGEVEAAHTRERRHVGTLENVRAASQPA